MVLKTRCYSYGGGRMKARQKVVVFGDSLFKGVIFNEHKKKYQYLEKPCVEAIIQEKNMDVDNRSRFGLTTTKAVEYIGQCLEKDKDYDYAVIELGGNDCNFKWEEVARVPEAEHQPIVSLAQFELNLIAIIDLIKKNHIVPIIVTLPPISSKKYFDWISKTLDKQEILKWLKEENYIYKYQELYNNCLTNIARKKAIQLIDLRLVLLKIKDYENYLCIDGIHLNENGHRVIVKSFRKGELKI